MRIAKRVLDKHKVPYREVFIDKDSQASLRVKVWTGFLSVPTLVVTRPGEDVPITEPEAITLGISPRGINRGSIISEANTDQLTAWLRQNGFVSPGEDAE